MAPRLNSPLRRGAIVLNAAQFQFIDGLLTARDLKKAEVQIARLLRSTLSDRDRAAALVLRARARLLSARPTEALDDLSEALDLDPALETGSTFRQWQGDAYFARFELASVGFADRSDAQRAEHCYLDLLRADDAYENEGWVRYQLGRICLSDQRVDEAIAYFRDALLAPTTLPTLLAYCFERLGFTYFYERRDLRLAVSCLDKALYAYPPSADPIWLARLHTLRSRVLHARQKREAALEAVEKAVSIAQEYDDTRLALADALLASAEQLSALGGRDRDVIARLQQFIQVARRPLGVDVTFARAYELLGSAYANCGQHAAAGDALQTALQYNPYTPWEIQMRYRIARCYYHAEAYDKAARAAESLIAAAQGEGEAVEDYRVYDLLGSAQFALGHYDEAADAYRRALDLMPADAPEGDKIERYHQFARELRSRA